MWGSGDDANDSPPAYVQSLKAVFLLILVIVLSSVILGKTQASGAVNKKTVQPIPMPMPPGPTSSSVVSSGKTSGPTSATVTNQNKTAQHGTANTAQHKTAPKDTTTTTLPLVQPSQVTVMVANGTSVAGAAGKVVNELTSLGYKNGKAVNASTLESASAIYYMPGYQPNAQSIASFLQIRSSPQTMPANPPVSSVQGIDILVVLGPTVAQSVQSTSTSG